MQNRQTRYAEHVLPAVLGKGVPSAQFDLSEATVSGLDIYLLLLYHDS